MNPPTETKAEATPLLEREALTQLPVEHLCDVRADLESAQVIGTPAGNRLTFIVKGGRVEGPKLNGELLPGGGDWVLIGEDLVGRADIRATVRTDDEALIHLSGLGVIKVPPDGMERLQAGERLPFEETYVRMTFRFETSDERYSWLCGVTAVTNSELSKDRVEHRIYQVL